MLSAHDVGSLHLGAVDLSTWKQPLPLFSLVSLEGCRTTTKKRGVENQAIRTGKGRFLRGGVGVTSVLTSEGKASGIFSRCGGLSPLPGVHVAVPRGVLLPLLHMQTQPLVSLGPCVRARCKREEAAGAQIAFTRM